MIPLIMAGVAILLLGCGNPANPEPTASSSPNPAVSPDPTPSPTPAPVYAVTYMSAGETSGSVPVDAARYPAGSPVRVAANSGRLYKPGYALAWNTASDGSGTSFGSEATITMPTANLRLYAEWVAYGTPAALPFIEKKALITIIKHGETGTFTQSDTEFPQGFSHTLSAYAIGKYEVTYELWYAVRSWAVANGYAFSNTGAEDIDYAITGIPSDMKNRPAVGVNWRDCIAWCNAYSEMLGLAPAYYADAGFGTVIRSSADGAYGNSVDAGAGSFDDPFVDWNSDGMRLPSEGEWQYAASAGGITPYGFASGAGADCADAEATGIVAWYDANSAAATHETGLKAANRFGLHDMSGNVWELCFDWHSAFTEDYPGTRTDFRAGAMPPAARVRISRGGSAFFPALLQQIGYRQYCMSPFSEDPNRGFRLACKR
jgi:formylglycine-generating enzyme required for sulfatase activity